MATVIRIIKYEGDEAAVRKAIQLSKPLGITDCGKGGGGHWKMTIAEHYNDLPQLVELTDDEVGKALFHSQLKNCNHSRSCAFEMSNGGVCLCGVDD